jgi:hypothetical protein
MGGGKPYGTVSMRVFDALAGDLRELAAKGDWVAKATGVKTAYLEPMKPGLAVPVHGLSWLVNAFH